MGHFGAGVLIPQPWNGTAPQISSRINAERERLRWPLAW